MQPAVVIVASATNRWLIAFSAATVATLLLGMWARHLAREAERDEVGDTGDDVGPRSIRRRAGAMVAIGPMIGLACAPDLPRLVVVTAIGAAALAVFGWFVDHFEHADRASAIAVAIAAVGAVAAGARFGPTGVEFLDIVGALLIVFVVTETANGFGNVDALAASTGAVAALGVFAPAAFGTQDALPTVAIGLVGACFGFLAFNLRPASLFIGRAGRLAIGYAVAVGVLALRPVPGSGWRDLTVPLILLGVFLLDSLIVVGHRLRYRRPLTHARQDHIVHRLVARGWSSSTATTLIVVAQVALTLITLFTARAVLPVPAGVVLATLVLLVLGIAARRAAADRDPPPGVRRGVKIGIAVVIIALVAAMAPAAIAALDSADLMQSGKDSAVRGLDAARNGDTTTARGAFKQATRDFRAAADKLGSPTVTPSLAVPFVASNVRAARTLADIGTELASTGESLTAAINPKSLEVVDGRLPLEEVAKVQPKLTDGATALEDALTRIDDVADDPYLVGPVQDAVRKVQQQLRRAAREARRAKESADLADAIFGGGGVRHYLLIITNNAESRATGGFTGSYSVITADNGKLTVGDIVRTGVWNRTLRDLPQVVWKAPIDYQRRYTPFRPETNLQNVNLSPDFPSITEVLLSLAPQAGVGEVDGVMSVDPEGLAALLRLTGPVDVASWPERVTSDNVVDVTLRDAYAQYPEDTEDRVNLLSDVAKAAVDKATSDTLGKPSAIAKTLGAAAHEGHIILGFRRPEEQRLAEDLGVAMHFTKAPSDGIALTTSNAGGNKIDYYQHRDVDYQVELTPNGDATEAIARATFKATIHNQAPATGLPQIVIGPFDQRFVAGQSRNFVSMYTPLQFVDARVGDSRATVDPNRERFHNVVSFYADVFAQTSETITSDVAGKLALHQGWYSLRIRHQPTLNPDHVHVSVDVPEGWHIDKAPGMRLDSARRASVALVQQKDVTLRVHLQRDSGTWDLWQRLRDGR